jgi:hypothetical protein
MMALSIRSSAISMTFSFHSGTFRLGVSTVRAEAVPRGGTGWCAHGLGRGPVRCRLHGHRHRRSSGTCCLRRSEAQLAMVG